ncbi:MAG: metallophosphoesterase [Coprococcus sp.]
MRYLLIGILIFICLMAIFVFVESYRENRMLSVSEYVICSNKITKKMTAVMLSDLHNSEYGGENYELIKKIDELHPDIVLIAGDFIIGKKDCSTDIAIKLLNILGNKYDVYISKGNHELRCSMHPEQYGDMWEQLYNKTKDKVNWLINDNIYLDRYNINIYGLDMDRAYYQRFKKLPMNDSYLKGLFEPINNCHYNILLAHNPDYFEEYAKWGADLSLSGHVHGGMIIIPGIGGMVSPMVRFFPKYYNGIYTINKDNKMIVSRGLGSHTLKFRVNNKPEISYITIKPDK